MIKAFIFIIILICFQNVVLAAPEKRLHYKPEVVTLAGTIEAHTFPGLPNFSSIKEGDEAERGRYLRLSEPVTVIVSATDTDTNAETEKDVTLLHLTCDDKIWKKLTTGKQVLLRGTLFHQLTGHHHSRVLMTVLSVEEPKT
jgi:hypothetical protein